MTLPFLDYQIEPVEGSPLRRLFATIFALMAFVGGLYAFRLTKWWELAVGYTYAAGAIGVSFAGDLISLFVFWELMALFSTLVVWSGGTPAARAAGIRYAILHLLGGVILKIGIDGISVHTGSVDIRPMLATDLDTWLILIGLLINAAAPPLSAWLADAYPESSPTGSLIDLRSGCFRSARISHHPSRCARSVGSERRIAPERRIGTPHRDGAPPAASMQSYCDGAMAHPA